jgi:ATP-dependent DNA helicase RecG
MTDNVSYMKIDFSKLTSTSESETLELKESFSNEALESVGALANAKGGTIIIGVKNNGRVCGIPVGSNTLEEWAQKIQAKMQPRILTSMRIEKHDGKTVGIIKVDRSEVPVSVDGRFFKRVGRTNQLMSYQEIMYLVVACSNTSWDSQIEDRANVEDLDKTLINAFLKSLAKAGRRAVSTDDTWQETFEKLELLKNGEPTRAAILLFGTNVHRFFPSAYLKLGRFKTETEILDDNVFDGPLFEQIEKAMIWLKGHMKLKFLITEEVLARSSSGRREEEWEYPLATVREGIVNAICHRDYKVGTDTAIKLFDDHLVIWNAGTLPPGLTASDLLKPHKSFPHNKLIAQSFYNTGIIEKWGSGTTRMVAELKQASLPAPDFDVSSPYSFRLTLSHNPQGTNQSSELNDRQLKALEHLKQHRRLTSVEYQQLVSTSYSTAKRDLADLASQGLVRKRGTGQSTEYLLTDS